MNERIKELLDQCQIETYGVNGELLEIGFDAEKFAQLIVKECDYLIQQQVSLKYKDGWEQCGLSDDWAGGHYGASILSRTVIKQHFGVEE